MPLLVRTPVLANRLKIVGLTGECSWCRVDWFVSDMVSSHPVVYLPMWVDNIRSTTPKWPVRSVEALPAFTRKALNNKILIIGNTVG